MWIQQYAPKISKDIIGNNECLAKIKYWLANFKNNPKLASSLIVSGPHGVGKTCAVRLILQEYGYNIHNPNLKSYKNIQNINELNISKKTAIIIDDSETITLTSEKNTISHIFKENETKKMFPIVFITNEQHSKLILDIKKSCAEIKFAFPTPSEIKSFILKIANLENLNIKDDQTISSIIKFSQFDIRRLIYILEDLKLTFKDTTIDYQMWKNYTMVSQRKDKDIGLFDATRKLLNSYKNMDSCMQLYETEKVLLPLMLFENYQNCIMQKNASPKEILQVMSDITSSISFGDVVETNIYTDQNWYLQNLHGFFTCAQTSFLTNKYPFSGTENYRIDFSSDLNKTSLKNINKKSIGIIQTSFKKKTLQDLLYVNKILHSHANNNRTDLIHQVNHVYNLPPKIIDMMFKVDKTLEKLTLNLKLKANKT
uniref:AAA+ ATPase domain-containing protein n=1 Tax=viral metagenome TaxID=1070528 RepID=A0A6C0M0G5_9ZZZZ